MELWFYRLRPRASPSLSLRQEFVCMGSHERNPLLQVRQLSVEYRSERSKPHQALDNVTFEIAKGEVVGLMGKSGCGKTTVALALLGLLPRGPKVSGSVLFCGSELLSMNERALQKVRGAKISMIYQEPEIALSPFLRAGDQIAEVVRAHCDWKWNRCQQAALAALEQIGFDEPRRIYQSYPHQLSGGQRQRVVFAQALVCEPALIIADEPTASLDARNQAEMIELLRGIRMERQVSLLLISHTPEIQASHADRLLVMSQGCVVEQGSFDQLYWNASHPVTTAMLRPSSPKKANSALRIEAEIDAQEQLVR
jgi:ABC-type glutathione transport system ATPase component